MIYTADTTENIEYSKHKTEQYLLPKHSTYTTTVTLSHRTSALHTHEDCDYVSSQAV